VEEWLFELCLERAKSGTGTADKAKRMVERIRPQDSIKEPGL